MIRAGRYYDVLVALLLLLGPGLSLASETKCIKGCWCESSDTDVSVQCTNFPGDSVPSLTSLDLASKNVSLMLDQPGLKKVARKDLQVGGKLIRVTIVGSPELVYDVDAFSDSASTLTSLDLDVGDYRFDQVFSVVSELGALEKLTLRCQGKAGDPILLTQPIVSGPVTQSLRELSIRSCEVKHVLAEALTGLDNLTGLSLPKNVLRDIPRFLSTLPLTSVHLDTNRIAHPDLGQLPKTLKLLSLSDNGVITMSPYVAAELPNLASMDLSDNPHFTPSPSTFEEYSRGFLNLARTNLDTLDILHGGPESPPPAVSLEISGTKVPCSCQLQHLLVVHKADISGTCVTLGNGTLHIPGPQLAQYLKSVDCDCLTDPKQPCASGVSKMRQEWLEAHIPGSAGRRGTTSSSPREAAAVCLAVFLLTAWVQ
ncbi:toll-like receptor 13 [Aplysia californica]|uniref:Toll-like receptor 13 n=1 Tax=Aplysia californica TaxID=6500 RepID=A0ABM0JY59_APLCA|nr:toll-like receptor 13 [Aplysia californica]